MLLTCGIIMMSRGTHKRVFKAKAISKTTPRAQGKKPLDKHHRMWYNKGGKKAESHISKVEMARHVVAWSRRSPAFNLSRYQ